MRKQGHDVIWVRTDCPAARDRDLLDRAEAEGRILFTLDKDFWQLTLQRPARLMGAGVILFRALPAVPENIAPLVDAALRSGHPWHGYVSIVTKDGIEMIRV